MTEVNAPTEIPLVKRERFIGVNYSGAKHGREGFKCEFGSIGLLPWHPSLQPLLDTYPGLEFPVKVEFHDNKKTDEHMFGNGEVGRRNADGSMMNGSWCINERLFRLGYRNGVKLVVVQSISPVLGPDGRPVREEPGNDRSKKVYRPSTVYFASARGVVECCPQLHHEIAGDPQLNVWLSYWLCKLDGVRIVSDRGTELRRNEYLVKTDPIRLARAETESRGRAEGR
jgi:hypothetical protein